MTKHEIMCAAHDAKMRGRIVEYARPYKRTVREGCLPKEDQNNSNVLREVSLAAMIFV